MLMVLYTSFFVVKSVLSTYDGDISESVIGIRLIIISKCISHCLVIFDKVENTIRKLQNNQNAGSVARIFFENIGHFAKKFLKFRTPYNFTYFAFFIAFLCDNF